MRRAGLAAALVASLFAGGGFVAAPIAEAEVRPASAPRERGAGIPTAAARVALRAGVSVPRALRGWRSVRSGAWVGRKVGGTFDFGWRS